MVNFNEPNTIHKPLENYQPPDIHKDPHGDSWPGQKKPKTHNGQVGNPGENGEEAEPALRI